MLADPTHVVRTKYNVVVKSQLYFLFRQCNWKLQWPPTAKLTVVSDSGYSVSFWQWTTLKTCLSLAHHDRGHAWRIQNPPGETATVWYGTQFTSYTCWDLDARCQMLTSCQWQVDGYTWDLLTPPPGPLGLQLVVEVEPRSCISPRWYSFQSFLPTLQMSKRWFSRVLREIPLPGTPWVWGGEPRSESRQVWHGFRKGNHCSQSPSLAVKSNTSSDPAPFLSWGQSSKLSGCPAPSRCGLCSALMMRRDNKQIPVV